MGEQAGAIKRKEETVVHSHTMINEVLRRPDAIAPCLPADDKELAVKIDGLAHARAWYGHRGNR